MEKKNWISLVVLFLVLIFIDQYSKILSLGVPNYQRWGLLNFNQQLNDGVFLGFFRELSPLIRTVAISALGMLVCFIYVCLQYFLEGRLLLFRHGVNLFFSGIFGNLIDRVLRGHIIDFIAFGSGNYKSAVFNFADFFLWIGVIIIIYVIVFDSKNLFPENSKRKRYIVNKTFQYKMTFTILIFCLFFCIMNFVISYTFFNFAIDDQLADKISPLLKGYLMVFGIFSFLFLSFIFYIGIVVTNRIAGPVYAFKRFLNEFIAGERRPLKLRKGDEFKELEQLSEVIIKSLDSKTKAP
jgi:signal peptidase II